MTRIEEILALLAELAGTQEAAQKFMDEPRSEWGGLTPKMMIAVGKEDAVYKFLKRVDEGDPIS